MCGGGGEGLSGKRHNDVSCSKYRYVTPPPPPPLIEKDNKMKPKETGRYDFITGLVYK